MPPFRATTVRLAQIVVSPDCDISEVAELIAHDEAMTVDLLRAANSAAYANHSQIATVNEALSRLGTPTSFASVYRPIRIPRATAYCLSEDTNGQLHIPTPLKC